MDVTRLPESRHAAEVEIAQLEANLPTVRSNSDPIAVRWATAYRMWRLAFLRGLLRTESFQK